MTQPKTSYGTSESEAFTSTGRLKLLAETDDVCPTCDLGENGPTNFHVIRQSPTVVELICPNCGSQKSLRPNEVKYKLSSEEGARRALMIAAATAKPAIAVPGNDPCETPLAKAVTRKAPMVKRKTPAAKAKSKKNAKARVKAKAKKR